MALALNSRALFTPAELDASFLGSSEEAGAVADDSTYANEATAICNTASDLVRAYLDRPLIVQARTLVLYGHWVRSGRTSFDSQVRVWEWPVVQVTTSGAAVTLGTASDGGQVLYANDKYEELAVYVGYRRHEWANAAACVSALGDVADLTATPPLLPHAIRDVALEIARYLYSDRKAGKFTGARKVQTFPSGQVVVDASDRAFIDRALSRIDRFRLFAV